MNERMPLMIKRTLKSCVKCIKYSIQSGFFFGGVNAFGPSICSRSLATSKESPKLCLKSSSTKCVPNLTATSSIPSVCSSYNKTDSIYESDITSLYGWLSRMTCHIWLRLSCWKLLQFYNRLSIHVLRCSTNNAIMQLSPRLFKVEKWAKINKNDFSLSTINQSTRMFLKGKYTIKLILRKDHCY